VSNTDTFFNALLAILGLLIALCLALYASLDHWEKYPKHRKLFGGLAGILAIVAGILFWAWHRERKVQPTENDPPSSRAPVDTSQNVAHTPNPRIIPQGEPKAPKATPVSSRYNDWLRRSGTTILYNASRLIPDGCVEGTMAVGDFSRGGWGSGPTVDCRPDGWLAFDTRSLLEESGFFVDHTYCLNFVTPGRKWGQHGGPQKAPGMELIGVPAAEGPEFGINIGFRVVKTASGHEVEFTKEGVEHCG
jgi:hypothetical protein